jgi:hypothetical protein
LEVEVLGVLVIPVIVVVVLAAAVLVVVRSIHRIGPNEVGLVTKRFGVKKFPWVQVPAGEIGVVISQVGQPLPIGAKSARYQPELANLSDLRAFLVITAPEGEPLPARDIASMRGPTVRAARRR